MRPNVQLALAEDTYACVGEETHDLQATGLLPDQTHNGGSRVRLVTPFRSTGWLIAG
jgi:hypothetical protein